MALSDDDEGEFAPMAVTNYHFVDDGDSPISFAILPFLFDDTEATDKGKMGIFLRGTSEDGLQKVFKQVIGWSVVLTSEQADISVLSEDGNSMALLKPRKSYEEVIRTILISLETIRFLKYNPKVTENSLWSHLHGVFKNFDVAPSRNDLKDHITLFKEQAERDADLEKSELLHELIEAIPRGKQREDDSSAVRQPFFTGDEVEVQEMMDTNSDDSDEESDLFDSVCAICDNGGKLLCCEGVCLRSFHGSIKDGEDSSCRSLGYSRSEVEAIPNFVCKNCEHKQHQCFYCGKLGSSDLSHNTEVFLCVNATCGYFYHPKCVSKLLHHGNPIEALECEKKILAGQPFTCPVHRCSVCNKVEDKTKRELQFAVCRRCPTSYHRKCMPSEIAIHKDKEDDEEDNEEDGEEDTEVDDVVERGWENLLPNRILIYCMKHEIDEELGTPIRDHIIFPGVTEKKNIIQSKKPEKLVRRKRPSEILMEDELSLRSPKMSDKLSVENKPSLIKSERMSTEIEPQQKKVKAPFEKPNLQTDLYGSRVLKTETREVKKTVKASSSYSSESVPVSSFPEITDETIRRVLALTDSAAASVTMGDISRKCLIPSTHTNSGKHIDKTITPGKVDGAVQAVQAALQKLDEGGNIEDAKAVCEPEVVKQLGKWSNKLKVYLSPFLHGMRYTSFGRHFTKPEKLVEIVDKLRWYVQPGDMIVDFCCGSNDFSLLMKEKLDGIGMNCSFKNYDVIAPKNDFAFEKRDWMSVRPKELPAGSQLIMGLNPPFGLKAALANKFIDKALTFKPKLIVLIVPKETERLNQKKYPYDLIWEDGECLSGKSFYLPGSVDVNDNQMDQWNLSPPLLSLWSRPDWTTKHKEISGQHDHCTVLKRQLGKIEDPPAVDILMDEDELDATVDKLTDEIQMDDTDPIDPMDTDIMSTDEILTLIDEHKSPSANNQSTMDIQRKEIKSPRIPEPDNISHSTEKIQIESKSLAPGADDNSNSMLNIQRNESKLAAPGADKSSNPMLNIQRVESKSPGPGADESSNTKLNIQRFESKYPAPGADESSTSLRQIRRDERKTPGADNSSNLAHKVERCRSKSPRADSRSKSTDKATHSERNKVEDSRRGKHSLSNRNARDELKVPRVYDRRKSSDGSRSRPREDFGKKKRQATRGEDLSRDRSISPPDAARTRNMPPISVSLTQTEFGIPARNTQERVHPPSIEDIIKRYTGSSADDVGRSSTGLLDMPLPLDGPSDRNQHDRSAGQTNLGGRRIPTMDTPHFPARPMDHGAASQLGALHYGDAYFAETRGMDLHLASHRGPPHIDDRERYMRPSESDIRMRIRMYGSQDGGAGDHSQFGRYSLGAADAGRRPAAFASAPAPASTSARISAIDKYASRLEETNFQQLRGAPYHGPGSTYAPDSSRGTPPNVQLMDFAPHPYHPYPRPGGGGWMDH